MAGLDYKTKMVLPEKAYRAVYGFLATKVINTESDWKGFTYKGKIFYLDGYHTKAVKISAKRFLRNRKIELSDRVEQEIIDEISNIINKKE